MLQAFTLLVHVSEMNCPIGIIFRCGMWSKDSAALTAHSEMAVSIKLVTWLHWLNHLL